jgi:hypothetical protein
MTNRINTESPLQTLASLRDLLPRPVRVEWVVLGHSYVGGRVEGVGGLTWGTEADPTMVREVRTKSHLDSLVRHLVEADALYSLNEL